MIGDCYVYLMCLFFDEAICCKIALFLGLYDFSGVNPLSSRLNENPFSPLELTESLSDDLWRAGHLLAEALIFSMSR